MIHGDITRTIGHTPLVRLSRYEKAVHATSELIAKLEYFNPAGSAKDRIALAMLNDAEQSGKLDKGSVIIEPTSGNTGIGLAIVCAVKGYKLVLTMPESMSIERRRLLQAYGAEIVLTPASAGMQGAVDKANNLAAQYDNAFIPGQFQNPANPNAHYVSTGPEIWDGCAGELDCFVCGVGTGGSISGIGKYLKEKNKSIKVFAVEPEASPLLSTGRAGSHGLQGIGANFVPDTLDTGIYDGILTVKEKDAYTSIRKLADHEGIFAGISSAAALYAATRLAVSGEYKRIVVMMADNGERYLSVDEIYTS